MCFWDGMGFINWTFWLQLFPFFIYSIEEYNILIGRIILFSRLMLVSVKCFFFQSKFEGFCYWKLPDSMLNTKDNRNEFSYILFISLYFVFWTNETAQNIRNNRVFVFNWMVCFLILKPYIAKNVMIHMLLELNLTNKQQDKQLALH